MNVVVLVSLEEDDLVLVIGVEKMRDKSTEEGLLSRAASGHPIYTRGETAPVLFAPFATRHMLYPIPSAEIQLSKSTDGSGGLTQNPGW